MKQLNSKNLKALVATLVIVIMMSVFSLADNSVVSTAINSVTKSLFQLTASATASIDTADVGKLKEENQKLKKENAQLRNELAEYYDIKAENERLWKYYNIKKKNQSYTLVPANVIRRSANEDFYSFTLDIGSSDGVEINNPVITENGLVGWVAKVDATSCFVKTILSPDTKASATDKQTSDIGIISGNASLCEDNLTSLTKIAGDSKIAKGDMIVTTGAGGIYPKNLIVGKVKKLCFNSYDTSKYAIVEPYEDIKSITAAAVITDFDGKGESR